MASYRYGRPEPPLFKQHGWELRDRKFTVGGYDRIEGKYLREIFKPNSLDRWGYPDPDRGALNAMKQCNFEFKKVCFVAQLKHYGIRHSPSDMKVAEVRALLEKSVLNGKCDTVPESVLEEQRQMQKAYEPSREKWLVEFRAWDAKRKEQCTTPHQRADHDFDWFCEYYFLTDGKPDPTKTPDILELEGHNDKAGRIQHAVPGLCVVPCFSSVDYEEDLKLLLGWDRAAVVRRAEDINKEIVEKRRQKEEAEQKKRDSDWENALRPHKKYLLQRGIINCAPSPSFDLRRCVGQYVVRCDDIAKKEWFPSLLSMDIYRGSRAP